jgi:ABC-type amino acid transport substrate-binding protein
MPRTGKAPDGTPQGLDVAVAERVGQILGRPVQWHWCASAECSWHCLPEGRCDVVAGQPEQSGPARGLAWSVPYAGSQFGLIVPHQSRGVRSLADLHGKRVGIVAGTVALAENDHAVARFPTREALLAGFQSAGLDAAFLDADFAAWYLHRNPQLGLRLVPEYVPREHWNMSLAVRSKDGTLLVEINRALAQLAAAGDLREIYARAGVPFRPPFTGSSRQQVASDTWRRIRERGELVICMDPANLPYTSARADRPGSDVELARALAQELHVKLRIEWLDVQHETAVGELLQRQCDLVMGEAVAANAVADDEELAGKVLYSRPYYRTGYVLVERKNGPHVRSLADLKGAKAQRLGAEAGSVADYSLRQRGYLRRLYRNQLATLKALSDGDIDHAYLWANAGWTLFVSPDLNAEISPGYVPEDCWDIAVAMRRGDDELKRRVDVALAALVANGTVASLLDRYHLRDFGRGKSPAHGRQESAQGALRHDAANRGPEPQMQKIQPSKKPYGTLVKVRSAGELVVGLDQNNLPFSTAHPEPAGLDYEIARLLAAQLGARLRVYWAYSSHDSYPSKLSTKGLCDVILGIMPDDRFGQRVLFSRPYYRAKYLFVVRSGEGPPGSAGRIAVEEGVAIGGLKGRSLDPYPSTEAILEAVATGRVKAGYVISTRGPWLAQKHWPGKLAFLAAEETADCFPITAAVRKADLDLKNAIDRAWVELGQAGQLAQVFARWHIPYHAPASPEPNRGPHP